MSRAAEAGPRTNFDVVTEQHLIVQWRSSYGNQQLVDSRYQHIMARTAIGLHRDRGSSARKFHEICHWQAVNPCLVPCTRQRQWQQWRAPHCGRRRPARCAGAIARAALAGLGRPFPGFQD